MESIPVSKVQHYQGNAFYIQIPKIQAPFGIGRSDTNESPRASRLEFFVDDTPLAPHQSHADLVAGKPGFSHWENAIIFSTGSPDLKASARELKVVVPVRLPSEALLIAALLVLMILWRRHYLRISALFRLANRFSRQAGWVAIGSFSVLIVWTVWADYPDVPIVSIDGLGYIKWEPKVPVGYPIFVSFIAKLFSSLGAVVFAQVILYCVAVLCLYWQATKDFISPHAAAVIALLLLGAGRIMNYNLTISTDGLFATILIFHMAAALSVWRSLSMAGMIGLGVTAGLAIGIRPAAYFLLGGLFVLFVIIHGQRLRLLKGAGAALLAVMLLFQVVTTVIHGDKSKSLLGLALFPHVMHLFEPSKSAANPQDVAAVDRATRDYRLMMREKISSSWEDAYDFEANSFNPVTTIIYHALYSGSGKSETRIGEVLTLFEKLAIETALNNPAGYLEIIIINFRAAYTRNVLLVSPPGYENHEGASLRWWMDQSRGNALAGLKILGLTDQADSTEHGRIAENPPTHLDLLHQFPNNLRLAIPVAIVSLLFGSAFSHRKRQVSLFGLYALILHFGGTLLVCLSTVSIPRYSTTLDVFLLIAIGCAIDVGAHHLRALVVKFRAAQNSKNIAGPYSK